MMLRNLRGGDAMLCIHCWPPWFVSVLAGPRVVRFTAMIVHSESADP